MQVTQSSVHEGEKRVSNLRRSCDCGARKPDHRRSFDLGAELPREQDQTPQALAQLAKSEIDKWVPVIKSAGVDVQ